MVPANAWKTIANRRAIQTITTTATEYVTMPSVATALSGLTAATISAWIELDASGADFYYGFYNTLQDSFAFFQTDVLYFTAADGGGNVFGYTGTMGASLFHVCFVYDGSQTGTARIAGYLNGTKLTLTYGGTPPAALPTLDYFQIGNESSTKKSSARHADTCAWSRALTQSEISALADQSNVMLAVGGNPLLRYRRKWWPVSSGAVVTTKRNLVLGGGVI